MSTTNSDETEDISQLCRVCLQLPDESQYLDLNLIYDEDEQLTYSDCFTMCTQINIAENENLPHNICKSCGLELQIVYDFHKKVEHSKNFLAQLGVSIEQHTTEDEQAIEVTIATASEKIRDDQDEMEMALERIGDGTDESDEIVGTVCLEDYQNNEDLYEDAETVRYKIGRHDNESEETETIESSDGENATIKLEDKSVLSWQEAVVTVANESHLPVGCEGEVKIDDDEDDDEKTRADQKPSSSKKMKRPANKTGRKRFTGKYSCDYCQKVFPNHSRMLLHRISHEDDRPKYPCADCGRMYATKQALQVHVRTLHTKTGYSCPVCDKVYAIRKALEVHMRFHTGDFPYVCDICGRKFAQMGHLNTHKNVQHNSVRFSCDYPNCGKFFTSSSSLRNHEFSHSTMPFECDFCQRGYPSKSKLKVHIKRKHDLIMTIEDLEQMRKFHVPRSKLSLVKVKVVECEN